MNRSQNAKEEGTTLAHLTNHEEKAKLSNLIPYPISNLESDFNQEFKIASDNYLSLMVSRPNNKDVPTSATKERKRKAVNTHPTLELREIVDASEGSDFQVFGPRNLFQFQDTLRYAFQ